MKIYKSIIILFFFLCLFFNRSNIGEAIEETSVQKILTDTSIEAATYWNVNNNEIFPVVVYYYTKKFDDGSLKGRKLIVYKKSNSEFIKIFEHDAEMDHFAGMFILNDKLMTIWIGGSAYHIKIFAIKNDKIIPILKEGSHNFPEIIDIDNDGQMEILLSEGAFLIDAKENKIINYPEKTIIYKWNGKKYELIKTVPWKKRLNNKN